MKINYEVLEEDYIKFNIYHAENTKSYKKSYNMLKYWIPLITGVIIFYIGSNLFKQPKLYWGTISLLFLLVWIIRFPITFQKLITKAAKEMLKDADNYSMIGKNTMIIEDNQIKVISKHSTKTTDKEGIKNIKIYDDMILIYLSGVIAHIVPTRYLNESTKKELIRKLQRN